MPAQKRFSTISAWTTQIPENHLLRLIDLRCRIGYNDYGSTRPKRANLQASMRSLFRLRYAATWVKSERETSSGQYCSVALTECK
jgi:hypothetical protein